MCRALFVFLLFITSSSFSQGLSVHVPTKKIELKNDSAAVVLRTFDQQKIKEYHLEKAFRYDEVVPVNNWWGRFWRWFWELIDGMLTNKYSGGVIKYLVILIAAALVIFVVIKLIGLDLKIFAGKAKAIDVPYQESVENIHEINFNDAIAKAVAEGNYRLAVRLLYLHSLKLLNDKEIIYWQPEKTNQAYVSEITETEMKRQFTVLTLQFEYIWYGDFSIDKVGFGAIKSSFDRFNVKAL
uniref:hypothetical protein n=1 Tax=Pedobacter schmidteae TaxID=2201271 RepID=UPI000EB25356|nr:hypothetical protein [Pedobacter schmidteae]